MQSVVDDLRANAASQRAGGTAAAREKHTKAGKTLWRRERITALSDPGLTLLRIVGVCRAGVYGEALPGRG